MPVHSHNQWCHPNEPCTTEQWALGYHLGVEPGHIGPSRPQMVSQVPEALPFRTFLLVGIESTRGHCCSPVSVHG